MHTVRQKYIIHEIYNRERERERERERVRKKDSVIFVENITYRSTLYIHITDTHTKTEVCIIYRHKVDNRERGRERKVEIVK